MTTEEHRKQIIALMHKNREIITLESGHKYYYPRRSGAISAYDLRIIADELDKINSEWDAQIKNDASILSHGDIDV